MTPRFHLLHTDMELPAQLNNPFDYEPHPLCMMAADLVRAYINNVGLGHEGKMLGVLVCLQDDGQLGFLAAYSGLLAGRNDWDWFVPPVFDAQQPDGHFKQTERAISSINAKVRELESSTTMTEKLSSRLSALRQRRKTLSEELQLWLFRQYQMINAKGETKDLVEIWRDYHPSLRIQRKFPLPPGGTGDCCAPKLLQYAFQQHLRPLCIAEFWQGESPKGEIRHDGHFYPACSGKCKPILSWMLQGLQVATGPLRLLSPVGSVNPIPPTILYEDNVLVVLSKPSGLLSVPGRSALPSVESFLRDHHPEVESPMIVHRLDMDTSGLMVAALTLDAYRDLQRQFFCRTIKKRYVARLQSDDCRKQLIDNPRGRISLPMRPDPLDRPRQVVDLVDGKEAVTDYEVLSLNGPHPCLALTPHTGRTHQLRVHCAHPDGLNCPILGDALYGQRANRLYLHAEHLEFRHPQSGQWLSFHCPAPF